ncbi:MAG: SEC-C metal-binding domain-containing protein [Polyangiaceae bacterium]|jgi:tetratricopeptide (TPR) repeat protein
MSGVRFLASRFAGCTQGVLDRCVRAVVTAADLDEVVPGFSAHRVALVARDVIEVLEAGDLEHAEPPGSDWLRTIVAEARFFEADRLRRQGDQQGSSAAWDRARDILEEVAASSDRSSVLWYEDIYFEAVQALLRRRDRKALVRQVECIAEGLTDADCPNLDAELRDLALVHLELGDYREGLSLFAALHRHDPSDPWAYNAIALNLPRLGLPSLGRLAAERGLELVRRGDDRERLSGQLTNLLQEAGTAEDRSDAPKDAVDEVRDALRTDFDAKGAESSRELALRLIPELARARVKQLPPMPTADALIDIGNRLLPFLRASLTAAKPPPTWLDPEPAPTITRVGPKVGRNDPCPCGSGRKFKKCCIDKPPAARVS